jgi:hypothetical protein
MFITECFSRKHVGHTTRRADNDLRALLESFHVLFDIGTTDARVACHLHEIAQRQHYFLDLKIQNNN